MADGIAVKLEGVDALNKVLAEATKQIRTKAVRSALRKAGQVISKEAKQAAPVLSAPTKIRNPGTVKRAIAVRGSKFARQAGNEGVFINVRPLRGSRQKALGKAGAKNPNDPFYWRFIEFGFTATGPRKIKGGKLLRERNRKALIDSGRARWIPGKQFMTKAADNKGNEAIKTFMDSVVPQIEKLNAKAKR